MDFGIDILFEKLLHRIYIDKSKPTMAYFNYEKP